MLWRDPEDPERVLAVQSFSDTPTLQVVDLSGCPDACEPELAASWHLETQTGIDEHTHEATMSTDGRRIYLSQYNAGFFMLDSTGLIGVGEDEWTNQTGSSPVLMRGDLNPEIVGHYGTPEQRLENCTPEGFAEGTAPPISWFSPHDAIVFPNLIITTYYGASLRAIDIANPYLPVEVGHFLNKPVEEVRWCSYGSCRPPVIGEDGLAVNRPVGGDPQPFAFSFPLTHDGLVIYADVHSGLYILRYRGPHAEEIPDEGICMADNAQVGYEPCPPYGQTDWGTPGN